MWNPTAIKNIILKKANESMNELEPQKQKCNHPPTYLKLNYSPNNRECTNKFLGNPSLYPTVTEKAICNWTSQ